MWVLIRLISILFMLVLPFVGRAADLELVSYGSNKINVIKAVRECTGLGLADAKKLVEAAPTPVLTDKTSSEVSDCKTKIENAGGTTRIVVSYDCAPGTYFNGMECVPCAIGSYNTDGNWPGPNQL